MLAYEYREVDVRHQDVVEELFDVQKRRATALLHLIGARYTGYEVVVDGRWVGYQPSREGAERLVRSTRGE